MSTATYPLEDMDGNSDEPCVLVTSPNTQLAIKLFQHSMKTLGKIDAKDMVVSLVDQGIGDQTVSGAAYGAAEFGVSGMYCLWLCMCIILLNPRRACAATVTVVGLCVCPSVPANLPP